MNSLDLVHQKDWKYVGVEPDPDFNPEHNEEVIERTIKAAEANRRAKKRQFQQGLAERTEALATYLKSLEQGGKESDVKKYFGKKYTAYLAGKTAIERIKDGLTSVGANGRIIRRPGEIIE
jgi:hypothetical protein